MADSPSIAQIAGGGGVSGVAHSAGAPMKIGPGMTFIPNPAAPYELIRTPAMVLMLGEHADMAAQRAQEIAPVKTGAYRDSIEGQLGFRESVAWGRVNAKDFKAHWIEFGTKHWPAHATLRLACEQVGMRVRGGRRIRWRPSKNGTWY